MIVYSLRNKIGADLNLLNNNKLPWHIRILQGGGYVKQIEQGLFTFDFMGSLVVNKISNLLRQIFIELGCREVIFPIVQERKIWNESGRMNKYEKTIKEIDANFIFSPSHEELSTVMMGENVSYKDLPKTMFSIGHCFRKEIRPKNGLLRSKEFVLFDGYTFSSNLEQHNKMYDSLKLRIELFLRKVEIPFENVFFKTNEEVSLSDEFVVRTEHIGEKRILHCLACKNNYRASQFEACICGGETILQRGIEFADLIRNGTAFAEKSNKSFVNRFGGKSPYYMLSFGIGISKLLAVLIETTVQAKDFYWPEIISPFGVVIIPHKDSKQSLDETLANNRLMGTDVLIDDRDLSIGRRIEENKMLGIPLILVVKNGGEELELIHRKSGENMHVNNMESIVF